MMEQLGVKSTAELIRLAVRNGIEAAGLAPARSIGGRQLVRGLGVEIAGLVPLG